MSTQQDQELESKNPAHIQARKLEQILFNDWQLIYRNKIRRDPDFPIFTNSIYQKYYDQVYAVTRKAIETVHKVGMEYVGSKLKQPNLFMTNTDIDTIKVQTEFHVNLFFQALNNEMQTLQQQQQNNNQLKGAAEVLEDIQEHLSGFLAILKRIVVSAITIAYAKSILSKANQLPEGLSFTNTNNNEFKHKVRWVTAADERVCKICMPLHNQVFYTNDITTPLPGTMGSLGSHYNCRCHYVLIS